MRDSIGFRLAVYVTAVSALVGVAGVYIVYAPHQKALEKEEIARIAALSQGQHNHLVDMIYRLREDAQFLAGTPPLAGIARARVAGGVDPVDGDSEAVWRRRLEIIFDSMIRRRPEYAQIRLIDRSTGFEIVRVDRAGPNQILAVSGSHLQNKADASYVREALQLPPDGVHLSDISLNREYGRITLPWQPMLRAATPVYGLDGEPYAALVINYTLTALFDDILRGLADPNAEIYITNDEGDYLVSSVSGLGFGFDIGRPQLLQADVPEVGGFFDGSSRTVRQSYTVDSDGSSGPRFLHLQKVQFDPSSPSRFLAIGYDEPYDSLLSASLDLGQHAVGLALLLTLAGAAFVLLYVRRTLKPLQAIVVSTGLVADGKYDVELPPESRDEIGSLSRAFRRMIKQVEARTLRIQQQKSDLAASNASLQMARQEVENKAVELHQLGQYRSQFLARVSHDLRTPLNSMLILANALAENSEGHLDAGEEKSAKILAGAGEDLRELLNDLLELSKAEAGRIEILEESTELVELLRRVQTQFQPLAEAKNVSLELRLDPMLPGWISTDPRRLRQVLWNLVSNALKYTVTGSVTIEAGRTGGPPRADGDGPGDRLVIRVTDTGPGMDPSQLEHICSPYRRLERNVRSGQGGTGLGLAIVKELLSALGGTLEVTSEPGKGSCFAVLIPLRAADNAPPKLPVPEKQEPAKDARVLIADDDEVTRWGVSRVLQKLDPEVVIDEAETGEEAMEAMQKNAYTSVLLDYHLRGMDGFEVLRRLSESPPEPLPRILLHTGQDLAPEQRAEAEALSATVVVKQGDRESLHRLAERVLGHAGEGENWRPLEGRRLLLAEDDFASMFALKRQLCRFGAQVEEASNGYEALSKLGNRTDIDAVLLDIRMPIMDGYETVRRLRADPAKNSLPVLALTADATEDDREKCLQAGVTEFLAKPVDPRYLAKRLAIHIGATPTAV